MSNERQVAQFQSRASTAADQARASHLRDEMQDGHLPKGELAVLYLRGKSPLLTYSTPPGTEFEGDGEFVSIHGVILVENCDPRKVALQRTYRSDTGRYILPAELLRSALSKTGRILTGLKGAQLSNTCETYNPRIWDLIDSELSLLELDQENPWEIDVKVGRRPRDRSAVPVIRPRFTNWALKVWIWFNPDEVNLETIHSLFSQTGMKVGLGSLSPASRNIYGTFKVISWRQL